MLTMTVTRLLPSGMNPSPLLRYGVAVLAVFLALLLKLLVNPLIQEESPFLLFFGAVMVSAWFGGLRPGLLATALSALASNYFFLPPVPSFGIAEVGERIRLAMFLVEGSFIGGLTAVMQGARRRADESVREAIGHQETLRRSEEALMESREHYRAVVEQAAESIILVDPDTMHILDSNAAFRSLLGYSEEEIDGMTLYDFVAHDRESIERNSQRLRERERYSIGERQYRRKDGSLVDVEVNASVVRYGGKQAWSVVSHDVTERRRTERQLQSTLDNLLALYEAGRILGSTLEREEIGARLLGIVRRVSSLTAAALSLMNRQGRLGARRTVDPRGVLDAILDEPDVLDAHHNVLETGAHEVIELPETEVGVLTGLVMPLKVRERIVGVLEVYGPRDLAAEQTVETLTSIASQAASALENARLYEDLAEREHELQDLVGRLVAAQEDERRRVAYEVHDGLTQVAVAAHQRLEIFADDFTLPPQGRQELQEAIALVRRTVAEARRVIADLRPTTLDDFGLAAAIRMQVEDLRAEGYQVDYEEALGGGPLPGVLETTLFRVAQEALNNARKHAETDRVCVVLARREGRALLEIRDWGRGFEPAEVDHHGSGPGERVGLSSMRERVALLGGEFEIRSQPGAGTSVVAEVPVPPMAGEGAGNGE